MKIIDVRGNTKDEDDKIHFQYGDHDTVYLGSHDSIHIKDSWDRVIDVHESKIDDLIKALQLAKKEYFGE